MRHSRTISACMIALLALAACAGPEAPQAASTPTAAAPAVTQAVQAAPTAVAAAPNATAAPTEPTVATPAAQPGAPSPTLPLPVGLIEPASLANLRPLREVGIGAATGAALAPGGDLLALSTTAGVALFELPTLRRTRFDAITGGAYGLGFSPDGELLWVLTSYAHTQSRSGSAELRRVRDGSVLAMLEGLPVAFSPDGQVLALTQGDDLPTTRLVNTSDGAELAALQGGVPRFSADGRLVATLEGVPGEQQTTRIWQRDDGRELAALAGDRAAFSPDGGLLATVVGTAVQLWRLPTGEAVRTITTAEPLASAPAFSPDGQRLYLVAGSALQVWNVADGTQLDNFADASLALPDMGFEPGASFGPGATLLASFEPQLGDCPPVGVRLTSTNDGSTLYEDERSFAIAFSPDGSQAALVGLDGVRQVELGSGASRSIDLPAFERLAISPDGATLALGSTAASAQEIPKVRLELWDIISWAPRSSIEHSEDFTFGPSSLRFSPDGTHLVGLVGRGCQAAPLTGVTSWDIQATSGGDTRFDLPIIYNAELGYDGLPVASDYSPDGDALAWAEGAQVLLQRSSGVTLTLTAPLTVTALRFSPDGSLLALGNAAGSLQLVRSNDATPAGSATLPARVVALEFSPDASLLASRSDTGTTTIWSLAEGRQVAQLPLGTGVMVFTPDNQLLVSGTSESLGFYRVADGTLLQSFPTAVDDLAIGPGRRLLAVLGDGRVTVWGVVGSR